MDKAAFYAVLRKGLMGPSLDDGEVSGTEAILAAMAGAPLAHCAYALATGFKETNGTMQPVKEAYWLRNAEVWRKAHLRYWPWYGRGLVQVTWDYNYRKLDTEAAAEGLIAPGELMATPDLACRLDLAALALRRGMTEGWFTKHTLAQHLPDRLGTIEQFEQARRIINAMDCAHQIALYAMQFQDALVAGGWA